MSMKSKIIALKSGRMTKRYEDFCTTCHIFKGWKDKNQLGRNCRPCANKKIGSTKKGVVLKSDKYKDVININIQDYIKAGNVTKYRTSCIKCGSDRGYKRPDMHNRLCISCSRITKSNDLFFKKINSPELSSITFIDDIYISYNHKHNWKCKSCNFNFKRSFNDMNKRTNCPYCNKFSNENKCREIFEDIFDNNFIKTKPTFLRNPDTKYPLELDGYCEELKLAFEYDGEFHYKRDLWIYKNDSLDRRKRLDKLKDDLCKDNGIILIRIPYWENKCLESYIKQQLKNLGVKCAESGK